MNRPPVVSVVTPVYNGANYLEECIQSVLRQTYSDWEYVILDNCSTDATAEIAERYASQEPRMRVVRSTEFLDALDNHNRSMRAIDPRSRFCKVLHADDWLYAECLEKMVSVAERRPSIGVVSSFRLVGNRVEQESPLPYSQTVMSGHDLVRWELFGPQGATWVTGSPTTLLIRTDLVLGPDEFYDRTVWHSDTDAAYRSLMESDFGFVHQVLTYTRRHSANLMSFSQRVWSFRSRDLRLLIRYGPRVLSPVEYRSKLREWLFRYGYWLAKQALKPSRRRQQEFHDFHRREIEYMLAEPGLDRRSRLVLSACHHLLLSSGRVDLTAAAGPPSTQSQPS
jgi:glycosyltransferase involved in cell wall biosynthesis